MVELSLMTNSEYESYLEQAIVSYAEAKVVAGNWSAEMAVDRSRAEFTELLAQGLETPHQHLRTIRDAATGVPVGVVWFEVQRATGIARAYVNDLVVEPRYRRKGHATAAMSAVEDEARRMGCTNLSLHVFAHNEEAIALYRALGLAVTNLVMAKDL